MKPPVKRHEVCQPLDPSYKIIPLTKGQNTLVDSADYDWLNQWNWQALWSPCVSSFYAIRQSHKKTVYMARQILECKAGETADHKNHDTLDNRRRNLRKATASQNNSNQKIRSNNKSGFIGVSWQRHASKWVAQIHHDRIPRYLGIFSSPFEAARAYDDAARKYRGEFAVLNFPESLNRSGHS